MAMWPDDGQHDGRIDAAIDEVARRMTEGAPDSALKARVLARVNAAGAGTAEALPTAWTRGWRLAWMLSPLAVAALVIIAVVVFRESDRRSRSVPNATQSGKTAETLRPADTTRDRGPVNEVATAPQTTATVARQTPGPARPAASRRTLGAGVGSTSSGELAALAPSPLQVESIRLAALPQADSIRVAPLETIAPIDVTPLGEPDIDVSQPESRGGANAQDGVAA